MQNSHPDFSDILISLDQTEFDYSITSISKNEGDFVKKLIQENKYAKTIEIGCALGISSMYILQASSKFIDAHHTIIDPNQTKEWSNYGIKNIEALGADNFTLIEQPSEIALPKLLEQKEQFDFGFIDGWHSFDHTIVDFFYINRMLKIGGMVVIDDANWNSIAKVIDYISKYPCYELILPTSDFRAQSKKTLRKQLFLFIYWCSKAIPHSDRSKIFSQRLLEGNLQSTRYPNIVALKKIREDSRSFDWYEHF